VLFRSRLIIPLGQGVQLRDSATWLARIINGYGSYYDLPMLYNGGFVDMQVVQRIARASGTFYRSCVPDIYSGIAIASVIARYAYSHEPLAVNGASRHSTGASSFSQQEQPSGSPASKFRTEGNLPFHADVPLQSDGRYPLSMHALVYESYLQSSTLRDAPSPNLHEQQLEVVLATSPADKLTEEWVSAFAARHGLNEAAARRRAKLRRWNVRLHSIPERIHRMVNIHRVGSAEVPIRDVDEACLCAAEILENPPGLSGRLQQRAYGRVRELFKT
jgi:hypothetical protein